MLEQKAFTPSLRDRLRSDTASKHDCVDRVYSVLDLSQPDSLQTFLRAQLSVLRSVRCSSGRHAEAVEPLLSQMVAALKADLRELSGPEAAAVDEHQLDATAILYILLGSSLGTRVLHRRWLETNDLAVAAAGRYLCLVPPQGAWRALCAELAQLPAEGAEADCIVHAAGKLFDLHLAVLDCSTPLPRNLGQGSSASVIISPEAVARHARALPLSQTPTPVG